MGIISDTLRHMLSSGMDHEAIIAAVAAMEGKPRQARKADDRATRLPFDWWPDEAGWLVAREAGLPGAMAEREAERFRDYWHSKAGKDATKLDWSATWRNWCRTAADRLPRQIPRETAHDRLSSSLDRAFAEEPAAHQGRLAPRPDDARGAVIDLFPVERDASQAR
jgi:hypothetical protein